MSSVSTGALRAFGACAPVLVATLFAGCGGASSRGSPEQPIALTVTATDATTTIDFDKSTAMTFTVSNPTSRAVDRVQVLVGEGGAGGMAISGITCKTLSGTCPTFTGPQSTPFSMAPGSSLTFTTNAIQVESVDGDETLQLAVSAAQYTGTVTATAHVTAVDGRNGSYEIFTASGLRTALAVQFKGDASTFTVSSGSVDKTMTAQSYYYKFPSGGYVASAPDVLIGQADFGSGLDTFIAARNFVTALSDLDGLSFSTFNVMNSQIGAPAGTPTAPLAVRQAAISGTTMTVCELAVGAIASCDPAQLRHFALTSPQDGGGVFSATGVESADTFSFQVARSASSLILLRADRVPADGIFTIGFAGAQPASVEHDPVGSLGGKFGGAGGVFGLLALAPMDLHFSPADASGLFAPPAYVLTFSVGDDGVPGLMHGTRPTDAVDVYALQQGALSLVGTLGGEFGLFVDRPQ